MRSGLIFQMGLFTRRAPTRDEEYAIWFQVWNSFRFKDANSRYERTPKWLSRGRCLPIRLDRGMAGHPQPASFGDASDSPP
jgi:hypothetical protein